MAEIATSSGWQQDGPALDWTGDVSGTVSRNTVWITLFPDIKEIDRKTQYEAVYTCSRHMKETTCLCLFQLTYSTIKDEVLAVDSLAGVGFAQSRISSYVSMGRP